MNIVLSKVAIFIIVSTCILMASRSSLRSVRYHGFYRFFAWETLVVLILLNSDHWYSDLFGLHQIIAESCLLVSLLLALYGFNHLRRVGKPDNQRTDPTLLWIEKTTVLVTVGVYRYIRHPLISSFIILTWGIYLKSPSWLGAVLAFIVTLSLTVAAKVEERENIEFFGASYEDYLRRTKMFIPFVI